MFKLTKKEYDELSKENYEIKRELIKEKGCVDSLLVKHSNELAKVELKADLDFEKLKNSLRMKELEIAALNYEMEQYRATNLKDSVKEIEHLRKKIREISNDEILVDLKKATNEIKILENELELKNKLIKSLSELPDVKRMIDNIAEMRIPAVEEYKKIFTMINESASTESIKAMNEVSTMIEQAIKEFGYNRSRRGW